MSHIEKEKLIKADIRSIENRVRHAFYQGYDLGFKDGKGKSDYETRLKADKLTMLEGLKKEIIELPFPQREPEYMQGYSYCQLNILDYVIQQKINELKGAESDNNRP